MTLETLIEKAIAENTDPFTTDADIRLRDRRTQDLHGMTFGVPKVTSSIRPLVGVALRMSVPRRVLTLK
jgi:hypothetical protein